MVLQMALRAPGTRSTARAVECGVDVGVGMGMGVEDGAGGDVGVCSLGGRSRRAALRVDQPARAGAQTETAA